MSETAEDLRVRALRVLDEQWCDLMDGNRPDQITFAQGAVEAICNLGIINVFEAEAWTARMLVCRDMKMEGAHFGGRVWCAFCGDLEDEYTHEDDEK